MITRTFKLCLNAGTGSAPFINVSQTDQDEVWLFELYTETGERYIPSSGAIIGIKADGHGIANTGTVDSEGRVVITETEQMTAAAGRSIFELSIDGLTHGTANFIVNVEKKPIDGAIMSDSDLSLISQAVDSAAVIVDVIGDGDPSEVIGEHVDDWLDNHPEATTTVQDGAITAPKLNNSLWDKLLVSEEASGAVASFDDGADDVPVKSLKVALEPIQTGSGDPSPSNVRPIIAANGKNMMPSGTDGTYTDNGITCVCKGGVYTLTGTSTGSVTINIPLIASVDLSPSTNKIAFMNTQGSSLAVGLCRDGTRIHYWTMSNINTIGSGWTDSGNEVINEIRFSLNSGVTLDCIISPMLMLLSDGDYTYYPYQGIVVQQTGKNLLDTYKVGFDGHLSDTTRNGITLTKNADGSFKLSGTATAETRLTMQPTLTLLGGHTYTISIRGVPTNSELRLIVKGANSSQSGLAYYSVYLTGDYQQTVNMLLDDTFQYFFIDVQNGKTVNCTIYVQVEMNDSMTAYEPYTGTSYPYSLGQVVYGGTVDLATGVLKVNRVLVDLDTLTTGWQTATVNGKAVLRRLVSAIKQEENKFYIKCSHLKYVGNTTAVVDDGTVTNLTANYYNLTLCAPDLFTTQAELNAWTASQKASGTPVQLSYLVDPTTVQLTPTEVKTLLGYNNISSSGTVEVIYHADTKLYVDKMTAVDNAIIAPTEADFVATRNYTVNDLVIVNDALYKVTANIATGSAITPNSNVQQTTLSALIKALS